MFILREYIKSKMQRDQYMRLFDQIPDWLLNSMSYRLAAAALDNAHIHDNNIAQTEAYEESRSNLLDRFEATYAEKINSDYVPSFSEIAPLEPKKGESPQPSIRGAGIILGTLTEELVKDCIAQPKDSLHKSYLEQVQGDLKKRNKPQDLSWIL